VLMRNGMAKDFSWNASAREYVRVYERIRQLRSANVDKVTQLATS
jgi:glycogen synthase